VRKAGNPALLEEHDMTETATRILDKVAWVDLSAKDAAAARGFYDKVLGWTTEVNPDPQYGGYGRSRVDGKDVAGIGPAQSPDQPSAWSVYIGTDDLDGLSKRITDAGGTVIAPAFDVGDQGRMAVFRDPTGAFISSWEAHQMGGFQTDGRSAFGWADLNARNVEAAIPFYAARHAVKPGVTGWAQVKYRYGASVEDAFEKLRYDLYYIKHRSLVFDLTILIDTVKVIVARKGAQ